jgi:hypothetical protein
MIGCWTHFVVLTMPGTVLLWFKWQVPDLMLC